MSIAYLGLGSNLGNRLQNLENAARALCESDDLKQLRVSSIYETPALLPKDHQADWNRPFLNAVIEIKTRLSPWDWLKTIQRIEISMGRGAEAKWAPRIIDIDLLYFEGITSSDSKLLLPHPEIEKREFVLDPLAELSPRLILSNNQTALQRARAHPAHQPQLMGVLNLTPDSFSDGGKNIDSGRWDLILSDWEKIFISAIDLGAESTRPGAVSIDTETEWQRLSVVLQNISERYDEFIFRPKISVDTRNASVAIRAIEAGVDILNDVSGFADPEMCEVLKTSTCKIVLMHSLTVPADPKNVLPASEPASQQVRRWMETRLEHLDRIGIDKSRVMIDPGIGFGKTSIQSLEILKNIHELHHLDHSILVGHSRKSFLKDWSDVPSAERDPETIGISVGLIQKGVEILRVHDPSLHHRVLLALNHVRR